MVQLVHKLPPPAAALDLGIFNHRRSDDTRAKLDELEVLFAEGEDAATAPPSVFVILPFPIVEAGVHKFSTLVVLLHDVFAEAAEDLFASDIPRHAAVRQIIVFWLVLKFVVYKDWPDLKRREEEEENKAYIEGLQNNSALHLEQARRPQAGQS